MVSFKVVEKQCLESQLTAAQTAVETAAVQDRNERFLRLRTAIAQKSGRSFKPDSMISGASEALKIELLSTGIPDLDAILGGGLPRGAITEIFGPNQAGKTTLALSAIAQVQREGGNAAFLDVERRLNPAYAEALGVEVHNLLVFRPHCGETAIDTVCQLIRSGTVDLVVVDSVAALIPEAELAGSLGDVCEASHADLMSKGLQRLTSALNSSNSRCLILFLNQIRLQSGVVYGTPEIVTGGLALAYYASVRLDLRRIQTLKRRDDEYGIKIKAKVAKSSIAKPFQSVELEIVFGSGFEVAKEL